MKIRKVKWKDHPILGDLELDFTNASAGEPFDTVIIAGENRTGKTTILETISTFLNRGSFECFDYLEYVVDGTIYKAIQAKNNQHGIKDFFDAIAPTGSVLEFTQIEVIAQHQ